MSRSINHDFEGKCSEDTFNKIYSMAYARGIDKGKQELSAEIMKYINSGNRGSADYFIVDKIEEICTKYCG